MPRLPRRLARSLVLGGVALALGVRPVGAQEVERPIGWDVVFDDRAAEDSSLFFVAMAPGWHITSGPAALLYDPVRTAEGEFRLEAEVFLFPGESDSGFGLMFGGEELESSRDQSYFQFLVRRDGHYSIAHRAGSELHVLTAWTAHDAVVAAEGVEEPVLNTLGVVAEANAIVFRINGEEVARFPRSQGMGMDGPVGFRVGEDLNLHVRSLTVAKL